MVGRVGAYACRLFAVFNKAIRSGVPGVELGRLSSLLLGLVQVCALAFRVLVPAVSKQRQHFIRGFLFNFFNVNFQKEFFFIVQHFYIFVLQIKKNIPSHEIFPQNTEHEYESASFKLVLENPVWLEVKNFPSAIAIGGVMASF